MATATSLQAEDPPNQQQAATAKSPKRVRFDASVKDTEKLDVKLLTTIGEMVPYLNKAVKDKLQGNPAAYVCLVEFLSARPPNPTPRSDQLVAWLRALTQIVSSLTPSYSALVTAVLELDSICLSTADVALSSAYTTLLENLVSAHAHYITPVCERLIRAFRKGHIPASRAHSCLRHVLALIPTGPSFLAPIVSSSFPHKAMSVTDHYHYLDGILKMVAYAPMLREHVLALAVDRAIQIDVEIQTGIDELEEENAFSDAVFEELFGPPMPSDGTHVGRTSNSLSISTKDNNAMAVEQDDNDEASDDDDDDDETAQPLVISIRDTIQKLDAVLHLLFAYISSTVSSSTSPSSPFTPSFSASSASPSVNNKKSPLAQLFPSMLDIFERLLLPTYRSRYTQFIWFYACSLDSSLPETFLACLVQRAFDESASPATRVSAAAYIGSFLARAQYLNISLVKTCISLLNDWACKYSHAVDLASTPTVVGAEGSRKHLVFYGVCQSIMYTFCFRWKEFMESTSGNDDDETDRGGVIYRHRLPPQLAGFDQVLRSTRLNPLKFCASPIVKEFATLTSELEIIFLFTILESNRRVQSNSPPMTPTTPTASNYGNNNVKPDNYNSPIPRLLATASPANSPSTKALSSIPTDVLDTFFPFDPFHLPKSKKFVSNVYNEWQGRDDDAGSEEEEEEDYEQVMEDIKVAAAVESNGIEEDGDDETEEDDEEEIDDPMDEE
ncbi:hypothetical protein SmJEL517_g01262 [Synchytrium microbalum]|uniref:RNA polymerase I-specific transcription initiation factor RRN3 n=1 Tax=Synchytrium microbalum TaxID=1806994 RepID=A0A507CFK8_9FUNG|nr:uncharacterized protein SmJEL517_g01262 [Synchytrium microbalum]TPX36714.1 hypothetical protein SmJEL517_g01262 [Synchytrium microbalum]